MQCYRCGFTRAEWREEVYLLSIKVNHLKKKNLIYNRQNLVCYKDTCSCSESLKTLLKDEKVLQLFCLLNCVLGKPCHNCNCSLKGYFIEQHTGDLPVLMLTVFC